VKQKNSSIVILIW